MNNEYWREHWNRSASENIDLRIISGWGNRTFQEMLITINDISKKLCLCSQDSLLDIGCGAGLFEIAFAPWINEIYGIDYSEKMVELARRNCENYQNVKIINAEIGNLPFPDESFNKVLVNSMIQYLSDMNEVENGLRELYRIAGIQSKLLLSFVPDLNRKEQFLKGFYSLGLSENEIKNKIEANNRSIWFDKDKLSDLLKKIGFKSLQVAKPINPFHSSYCFDLIIDKN